MQKCEICNNSMQKVQLSAENAVESCENCGYTLRNLQDCRADAREHPYGGVGLFDKIRLWMTFRSIHKKIRQAKVKPQVGAEIGFGIGLLLGRFIDQKIQMHGSEVGMLDLPQVQALKGKFQFHECAAEDFTLAKNSVDFYYGAHVVEHLNDPQKVFTQAYQALKPGGVCYFITPNFGSNGVKNFANHWWNFEDPTHVRFFTPKSIQLALEKVGFQKVQTELPWWDSVSVEVLSLLRKKSAKNSGSSGAIMQSLFAKFALLFLLPWYVLKRIINNNNSSSLIVWAQK